MAYADFFTKATGFDPYPYQLALAQGRELPALLKIPTGAGKTEAAVLAWLYRRLDSPGSTPLRLVYCLPMRTLVEQTEERILKWLGNLAVEHEVGVVTLMGGAPRTQWYLEPERPTVIVGTQDMLLSRALNRGYGTGYNMWPVEYGLLNNDSLWVIDEVQLMANGLPTSTQLAGLRCGFGTFGPVQSLWMSATARRDWLGTIDHPEPLVTQVVELGDRDLADPEMNRRHNARKVVKRASLNSRGLREFIAETHRPGSLTLVIVNTVESAQKLYRELDKSGRAVVDAEKVLVHSRFREDDRREKNRAAARKPDPSGPGMIVVATQAVEAGVDISARTLITEIAPWASLVQRLGRCNRAGEYTRGDVFWMELDRGPAPYDPYDLERARGILLSLEGESAGPADLVRLGDKMEGVDHIAVIRGRDVEGLFDTTPDLSGSYLDVSQYVRGSGETGVSLFWRDVPDEGPGKDEPKPHHSETVGAPIGGSTRGPKGIKSHLKGERGAWRWDFLDAEWRKVQAIDIRPGMTLMLDAKQGGYSSDMGWEASSKNRVEPVLDGDDEPEDGQGLEPTNTGKRWISLSEHSRNVEREVGVILDALSQRLADPEARRAVELAALYHDVGKTHPMFQEMLRDGGYKEFDDLPRDDVQLAKGKGKGRYAGKRRHFRHELGSALAVLSHADLPEGSVRDLAAYLAAAHHGKVRLAIRSLPGARTTGRDSNSDPGTLLGYCVTKSETLPSADLGEGLTVPETTLDVSMAQMGMDEEGRRSWIERNLALLERFGPFKLAYLEAIVRAADMRASKGEQEACKCA